MISKKKKSCNDPKFLGRQVWATSINPDQTEPEGAIGSLGLYSAVGLFGAPSDLS